MVKTAEPKVYIERTVKKWRYRKMLGVAQTLGGIMIQILATDGERYVSGSGHEGIIPKDHLRVSIESKKDLDEFWMRVNRKGYKP